MFQFATTCTFTLLVIIASPVPSLYYIIPNSKEHPNTSVYQWKISSMLSLLAFLSICFNIHKYDVVIRLCITQMFYEKTLISFKSISYELHLLEYETKSYMFSRLHSSCIFYYFWTDKLFSISLIKNNHSFFFFHFSRLTPNFLWLLLIKCIHWPYKKRYNQNNDMLLAYWMTLVSFLGTRYRWELVV